MLKQILFSLTLLLCLGSYAQCVPNTNFTGLLGLSEDAYELTDSTTALPHAIIGNAYETFFDMRIPTDTAITYDLGSGPTLFDPVYISSITVNTVEGLPTDFEYLCASQSPAGDIEENNCTFEGGGYGCLRLFSSNVTSEVGAYPLNVVLDISASYEIAGLPIPVEVTDDTFLNYLVLIIEESDNSSLGEIVDARNFAFLGTHPNPSKDYFTVQYGNDKSQDVELKIYDILGNLIMSDNVNSHIGYNEFSVDASALVSGIYTVCLSNDSELFVKRIIIE